MFDQKELAMLRSLISANKPENIQLIQELETLEGIISTLDPLKTDIHVHAAMIARVGDVSLMLNNMGNVYARDVDGIDVLINAFTIAIDYLLEKRQEISNRDCDGNCRDCDPILKFLQQEFKPRRDQQ